MLAAQKARALRSQFATLNIVSMDFRIQSATWKTKMQGQGTISWDKKKGRESFLSDLHEIKNPDPFASPHLSFNLRHLASIDR